MGSIFSLAPATFNDKDTLDTNSATIDWGDGSAVEACTVNESPFVPPGDTSGADVTVPAPTSTQAFRKGP